MASLVAGLDNYTQKMIGEKGNIQYGWSNSLNEKIVQLFFQLVRSNPHGAAPSALPQQLRDIISQFAGRERELLSSMSIAFRLIGQTRDIVSGKGEQQLAFMQLWGWYRFYPMLALNAVKLFVSFGEEHPYGSWKDVKYLCNYVREASGGDAGHPMIRHVLWLAKEQLEKDWAALVAWRSGADAGKSVAKPRLSLAGKWLPREKSAKFGWMYRQFAEMCFQLFMSTAATPEVRRRASLKCKIHLKKRLVALNQYLDTVQVKMCGRAWSDVEFNNVTSLTLRKNKLAFQNKTKSKEQRSADPDRVQCAENYAGHLEAAKVDPARHKVHGKRCMVFELVKDALAARTTRDMDTTNLQWKDNETNNKGLSGRFIAMVDTSGSMEQDSCVPLYNAIGLGIRISEMSDEVFRHRILTFSGNPCWINLSSEATFVQKVHQVKNRHDWGMTTDFYKALQMILDVLILKDIPPHDASDMVLAVFSDMQIDSAAPGNLNTMHEQITRMYAEAGMRSKFREPYRPPHILFWNLRQTQGFPVTSNQENVTALSGYSSTLLNIFCDKGIDGLKKFTPAGALEEILAHPRYNAMETMLVDAFAR